MEDLSFENVLIICLTCFGIKNCVLTLIITQSLIHKFFRLLFMVPQFTNIRYHFEPSPKCPKVSIMETKGINRIKSLEICMYVHPACSILQILLIGVIRYK